MTSPIHGFFFVLIFVREHRKQETARAKQWTRLAEQQARVISIKREARCPTFDSCYFCIIFVVVVVVAIVLATTYLMDLPFFCEALAHLVQSQH